MEGELSFRLLLCILIAHEQGKLDCAELRMARL